MRRTALLYTIRCWGECEHDALVCRPGDAIHMRTTDYGVPTKVLHDSI